MLIDSELKLRVELCVANSKTMEFCYDDDADGLMYLDMKLDVQMTTQMYGILDRYIFVFSF